jgi:hypothetical protein
MRFSVGSKIRSRRRAVAQAAVVLVSVRSRPGAAWTKPSRLRNDPLLRVRPSCDGDIDGFLQLLVDLGDHHLQEGLHVLLVRDLEQRGRHSTMAGWSLRPSTRRVMVEVSRSLAASWTDDPDLAGDQHAGSVVGHAVEEGLGVGISRPA